jgi:hypothetical protein
MSISRRVLTRGFGFLRTHGLGATYRAALRRLRPASPSRGAGGGKTLPFRFAYEPVGYRHGSAAQGAGLPERRINWVIPYFYGASGGHRTIFRLTRGLEEAGYEVRFHIFGETHYVSASEATEVMRKHYFPLKATVHPGVTEMPPAEICMASSWETAYAVRDFGACRRKLYFVQDYEPSFYPAGTERVLAENTYRFGFECVCAGAGSLRGCASTATAPSPSTSPTIRRSIRRGRRLSTGTASSSTRATRRTGAGRSWGCWRSRCSSGGAPRPRSSSSARTTCPTACRSTTRRRAC